MENHNITKSNNHQADDSPIFVFCTNCYKFYYDKLSAAETAAYITLQLFFDEKNEDYFSGCPTCQTDSYLLNAQESPLPMPLLLRPDLGQ